MRKFVFAALAVLGLVVATPLLSGAAHAEPFPYPNGGVQGGTNG